MIRRTRIAFALLLPLIAVWLGGTAWDLLKYGFDGLYMSWDIHAMGYTWEMMFGMFDPLSGALVLGALAAAAYAFSRLVASYTFRWAVVAAVIAALAQNKVAHEPLWYALPMWLVLFPAVVLLTSAPVAATRAPVERRYGTLVDRFQPPARRESARVGMIALAVGIGAFWIASIFDHTWIVPIFGIIGVVGVMMGVFNLSEATESIPEVSIFSQGALIGKTFIDWSELQSVDHRISEFDHDFGLKSHASEWTFHRFNKEDFSFDVNHVSKEGDWLPIGRFHALLSSRAGVAVKEL